MPVRINLKEIFGSDSQNIAVDKLNFNFNKLLELGVGQRGLRGYMGPQGSLGPRGLQGIQGNRGNIWYVGSGNPTSQTFAGLQDGDFYIDSTNSLFYQYDAESDSWSVIVNVGDIVNDYLIIAGSTFERGLGESPADNRFIIFQQRGNDSTALNGDDIGTSVSNDILFLSNFNESTGVVPDLDFPTDESELFNALQSIYVNNISGIPKRYHFNLGSLFNDSEDTGNNVLSSLPNNFKFRHHVDAINVEYPANNTYIYKGIFSLTKPENSPIGDIDSNNMFEFQISKVDAAGPAPNKYEQLIRFGSKFALGEYDSGFTNVDGMEIVSEGKYGAIGVAKRFYHPYLAIDGNDFYMIETSAQGLFLRGATYQDEGNIQQLGTTWNIQDPVNSLASYYELDLNSDTFGNAGIVSSGDRLYIVTGTGNSGLNARGFIDDDVTCRGALSIHDLGYDPDNPIAVAGWYYDGRNTEHIRWTGAALCDIAASNDTLFMINNQNKLSWEISASFPNPTIPGSGNTYFQIVKSIRGKQGQQSTEKLSFIGTDSSGNYTHTNASKLEGAWKIKLNDNKAIVGTNRLRSSYYNNWNKNGYLTLVDTSDLENPSIPGWADLGSNSHVLDFDVSGNLIAIMYLKLSGSGPTFPTHTINIATYNVDYENNTITTDSTHYVIYNGGSITLPGDAHLQSKINKFGSVKIHGDTIYFSYRNELHIYRTNAQWNISEDMVHVSDGYYNGDVNIRVMDSTVVGDSLYVLTAEGGTNTYEPDSTYIYKIDVKDPTGWQVIWTSDAFDGGARLISVGNHLYVTKTNGAGNGILTPVEVNGYITDHARIGSLVSTNVDIIDDLNVGRALSANSVLVGSGGIFSTGNIVTPVIRAASDLIADTNFHSNGDSYIGTSASDNLVVEAVSNFNAYTYFNLDSNYVSGADILMSDASHIWWGAGNVYPIDIRMQSHSYLMWLHNSNGTSGNVAYFKSTTSSSSYYLLKAEGGNGSFYNFRSDGELNINKLSADGPGYISSFQSNGSNKFLVGSNGNTGATGATGLAGYRALLESGDGGAGGDGANNPNGNGGNAGNGSYSGILTISTGNGGAGGVGGDGNNSHGNGGDGGNGLYSGVLTISTGNGGDGGNAGVGASIGSAGNGGNAGDININPGNGGNAGTISNSNGDGGNAGNILITAGDGGNRQGGGTSGHGGDVRIRPGNGGISNGVDGIVELFDRATIVKNEYDNSIDGTASIGSSLTLYLASLSSNTMYAAAQDIARTAYDRIIYAFTANAKSITVMYLETGYNTGVYIEVNSCQTNAITKSGCSTIIPAGLRFRIKVTNVDVTTANLYVREYRFGRA